MMLGVILTFVSADLAISLAAINCPDKQYWNGTSCTPCSRCPMGFGVKILCSNKADTECQPCIPGYDYSNSTDMEPCIPCDQNSNCLEGNARVTKNCTIFSPPICQGCAEENYFDPGAGTGGGCIACSPPCGMFKVEIRKCITEHDRECRMEWTTKEVTVPSMSSKPTDNDNLAADNGGDDDTKTPTDASPSDVSPTDASPTDTSLTEVPWLKKTWSWGVIGGIFVLIVSPVVVFTAIRSRKRRNYGGNDGTRANGNRVMLQLRSPLMPRDLLDLPIRNLSVEQKILIADMLNDRDTYGYFYWERAADRVGLGSESRSWVGLQNPTQSFLTAYGDKEGSTVKTLIEVLRNDGLTHFATQIEQAFIISDKDQDEPERIVETPV